MDAEDTSAAAKNIATVVGSGALLVGSVALLVGSVALLVAVVNASDGLIDGWLRLLLQIAIAVLALAGLGFALWAGFDWMLGRVVPRTVDNSPVLRVRVIRRTAQLAVGVIAIGSVVFTTFQSEIWRDDIPSKLIATASCGLVVVLAPFAKKRWQRIAFIALLPGATLVIYLGPHHQWDWGAVLRDVSYLLTPEGAGLMLTFTFLMTGTCLTESGFSESRASES